MRRTTSAALLACLLLASSEPASADKLFEVREAEGVLRGESVTLSDGNAALVLSLPKVDGAEVLSLANPARIVVDVPGIQAKKNHTIPVQRDAIVTSVRIGSHPEKVRLVFDLSLTQAPQIEWSTKGSAIEITLAGKKPAAQATPTTSTPTPERTATPTVTPSPAVTATPKVTATPTPTATPTARPTPAATATATPTITPTATITPSPTSTATPSPTLTPTPSATPTPTATPAPTATPTPKPTITPAPPIDNLPPAVPGQQQLRGIDFSVFGADRQPVVRLMLERRPEFKLLKNAEKAYQLLLPQTRLGGSHLRLPFFPPRDFVGITLVSAEQSGGDVRVTIGVERGVKVTAFVKENELFVRPLNR